MGASADVSTVRFIRGARRPVPRTPGGEVALQAPPEIPRIVPGNLMTKLMPVVMVAAMVGMVALMFTSGMAANPMMLMFPAMMMISMLGMVAGGGRSGGARTAEANEDRKDYLRYLDQLRKDVAVTSTSQRRALEWSHPDPGVLWSLAGTARMWERRVADPDFCHVRVGRGSQRLATRLVAPETGPVEELEPVSAVSLRRFVRAHSVVSDLPTAVSMRGFAAVSLTGERGAARAVVRAMLASLCTFHDPDQVRVAVVCGPDTVGHWEWTKWLPHTQHDLVRDGAGSARMIYGSFLELESALGEYLSLRNRFARGTPPTAGVPHLVIVIDGGLLDNTGTDLIRTGLESVTLVDLSSFATNLAATRGLRLFTENGSIGAVSGPQLEVFGAADVLSVAQAETVARRLSPYRTASVSGADSSMDEPESISSWNHLLSIADVGRLDPDRVWVPRRGRDRLRVPIGVAPDGSAVEIDLKESAENGMGPHGLCIGATGSGKSEFLRTLVLGLITTHGPDQLNLVLVDFKGGATFAGLEDAPHVAAVITNLSDDLALVDRMKDALAGEMNRRQELLRDSGNFANVTDYEKARAGGAALAPLPALFVVVDEFSELLSQQPDFADLFVAIGRLGRSLHMHLLLASQRLEEGKLRGLDSHLSYRVGLKTFSANESRTVLGVPDAYHLPAQPGAGYLKCDSAEIVRFAASYVSGPYIRPRGRVRDSRHSVVDLTPRIFSAYPVAVDVLEDAAGTRQLDHDRAPAVDPDDVPDGRTVLDVVVDRLRGHGNSAHEVWLPPLGASPTLDRLIPNSVLVSAVDATPSLQVPLGVVDRPFDQRRDLLRIDLSSAQGHLAIVGGPQSGKSTAIRTLVMALALTHTPEQVQFYCLDFGGGTLNGLAGLPHVGSVANRLDVDRVRRTVAEVAAVIGQRERLFRQRGIDSMLDFRRRRTENPVDDEDKFGDVFLVVDGWASIRSDFESLEPALASLTAQGLSYGVHLLITASRWGEIRPATKDLVGTRIELKLGDPSDSEFGRAKAARVPENRPGRGITKDGLHLLIGLPRVDDSSSTVDLGRGIGAAVTAVAGEYVGRSAPDVRMLPESLPRAELLRMLVGRWPRSRGPAAELWVPLGIDEAELKPVAVDFAEQSHFLVFGDTECGKTSLLTSICTSLVEANSPAQVKLILADYRRTMLGAIESDHLAGFAASQSVLTTMMTELAAKLAERMPGPGVTQQQLRERSWWSGPEIFVIVDDYDLVATASGNPLTVLAEYLPHARDIGFHLVLARRSGGASRTMYDQIISRMKDLVSPGLVMSGSRDEGNLIGNVKASPMPAGRGTLIDRRGQSLVQLAWTTQ